MSGANQVLCKNIDIYSVFAENDPIILRMKLASFSQGLRL